MSTSRILRRWYQSQQMVAVSRPPAHTLQMHPNVPSYFEEDFQTNTAVESVNFSYDLGDTALVGEVQELGSDGISLKSRRKVYQNSDFPMLTWAEHQDEYLDEFLRLEGRGYANIYSKCGGCGKADPTYQCTQQTCYGPSLYCKTCIVSRHAVLPTHWIQEWNGSFFERRALKSLGLVIQLGHLAGTGCNNPVKAIVTFTVIDLTGIHNVNVNFCNCDSNVEQRQQLMRAFRHIVRQYRTTLTMKHAGRGHDPSGVKGTAQGELALRCWACPQAGRNLPAGWNNINWAAMPEDLRYVPLAEASFSWY
ncbi:hypothetical protein B0H14DRAFT_2633088 [Mycena olivaceomarginata]|nr:hypothetical protein B0H14DRAFT_2633088 [Mycena olivaceomarginata]